MKLEQKIGQRLMIGIRGPSLDPEARAHLRSISPGGVILFSRNIKSGEQIRELINEIKEAVQPSPLIAIDQEGGLVVRFFRDITIMPGNMALGAIDDPKLAYEQGRCMARELKFLGIDLNLAPVVDVATNPDNPGITIRSFGSDPQRVALFGVNFIQGTQSEGIGAVAKHFPGKGAAGKDAHFDLPLVDLSRAEMEKTHLHPFGECVSNKVLGVMSTHVMYPHLPGAEKVPATFAPELIKGYLREEMHFQGVVFSDDLEMGAITKFFPFAEAVANAVRAGHDMVLICSDYEKQRTAFETLLGVYREDETLPKEMEAALSRIAMLRRWTQQTISSPPGSIPESSAADLAIHIAERSITLKRGQAPIPIPRDDIKNIFALIPDLSELESVEEGFEVGPNSFLYRILKERFRDRLHAEFVALNPASDIMPMVRAGTEKADLVLAFIFNARFQAGQRLLVETLKSQAQKVIFLIIRNPFDLAFLGEGLTSILTYGYRKVQLAAAVKILAGDLQASGSLPI